MTIKLRYKQTDWTSISAGASLTMIGNFDISKAKKILIIVWIEGATIEAKKSVANIYKTGTTEKITSSLRYKTVLPTDDIISIEQIRSAPDIDPSIPTGLRKLDFFHYSIVRMDDTAYIYIFGISQPIQYDGAIDIVVDNADPTYAISSVIMIMTLEVG